MDQTIEHYFMDGNNNTIEPPVGEYRVTKTEVQVSENLGERTIAFCYWVVEK